MYTSFVIVPSSLSASFRIFRRKKYSPDEKHFSLQFDNKLNHQNGGKKNEQKAIGLLRYKKTAT